MNRMESWFGVTVHVVGWLVVRLSMTSKLVGAFSSEKAYHDVIQSVSVSNLDAFIQL